MQLYHIEYTLKGDAMTRTADVNAKDLKSAKNKIGRVHGFKTGRNVTINKYFIVGYF